MCVSNKHSPMLSVTEDHKLSLSHSLISHILSEQEHFHVGSMISVLKNYNGLDLYKLSVSQKPKLKQIKRSEKDSNAQLSCSKTSVFPVPNYCK